MEVLAHERRCEDDDGQWRVEAPVSSTSILQTPVVVDRVRQHVKAQRILLHETSAVAKMVLPSEQWQLHRLPTRTCLRGLPAPLTHPSTLPEAIGPAGALLDFAYSRLSPPHFSSSCSSHFLSSALPSCDLYRVHIQSVGAPPPRWYLDMLTPASTYPTRLRHSCHIFRVHHLATPVRCPVLP